MRLSNLVFRDTFETKASYEKLVLYFKEKTNDTYRKGYIDRDETQLFYFSGAFKRPFSTSIPIIQLNVENSGGNDGKIRIAFKLVDFALIVFGLANATILSLSIFKVPLDPGGPLQFEIALGVLLFSYGLLQLMYNVERSRFKEELEVINHLQ